MGVSAVVVGDVLRCCIRARIVLVGLLAALASGMSVARADSVPPELQLAQKYSPVVMVRQQSAPCDTHGEEWVPAPVEIVLGNPAVALKRAPGGPDDGPVQIETAPTAATLSGLGPDYYLDLPGDPLHPGCQYEEDGKKLMEGRSPVVYARVAREPGVTGLAVQYWFYWYFNNFNDKHESDWEMLQLLFADDSVADAIAKGPYEADYAQHGGGETAAWSDAKLSKEGTHPVTHPAAGSHAGFYGSALYLGTGENGSGFGCDDTRAPLRRVDYAIELLPDQVPVSGPYVWLAYQGRWGQLERGVNNGPTGPAGKLQWNEPFRWASGLRTSSPTVPEGRTFGPSVTGVFCGAVAAGSQVMIAAADSPWLVRGLVLAVILLGWLAYRRTVWSPVEPVPIDQRRTAGQIVRAAERIYGRNRRTYLAIGVLFVPLSFLAALIQHLLFSYGPIKAFFDTADNRWVAAVPAVVVGLFAVAVAYTLVIAVVVAALSERAEGRKVRLRSAYKAMFAHFGPLLAANVLIALFMTVLSVTIVGIPWAIKKAIDWSFTPQLVIIEERRARDAMRTSAAIVRGDWWRVAAITTTLFLIGVALGPIVGIAVIFVTSLPLVLVNVIGSLVYMLVVPYVAIALTLLYFDIRDRDHAPELASAEAGSVTLAQPT